MPMSRVEEVSFSIAQEHHLSFDILIDGQRMGQLVGPPHYGPVPHWLFQDGALPTISSAAEEDMALTVVAVCSCGYVECGYTACRIVPIDDTVILDEFEIDGIRCESSPDFEVPRHQWDQAMQDITWTIRNHRRSTA